MDLLLRVVVDEGGWHLRQVEGAAGARRRRRDHAHGDGGGGTGVVAGDGAALGNSKKTIK